MIDNKQLINNYDALQPEQHQKKNVGWTHRLDTQTVMVFFTTSVSFQAIRQNQIQSYD